jgi:hypothetical protein
VFDCGSKETVTPSATASRCDKSNVFPTAHCNVALPDTVTGPAAPNPPDAKLNVPPDKTVPPAYVLFPDNTNVPAPAFVRAYVESVAEITPPTVNALAATVTVRDPVKLNAPVPTFNVLVPTYPKFPAHTCALFPDNVNPDAASNDPPSIVIVPLPSAPAFPTRNVPATTVVPPEYVFAAFNNSVPYPDFVNRYPCPPSPIPPPTVSTFAFAVTAVAPANVTAPVPKFRF